MDSFSDSIFLFSSTNKCRFKCLYFDGDGFWIYVKFPNTFCLSLFLGIILNGLFHIPSNPSNALFT
uniref:IS66 family insertion sequence element accessory protein TnpB n=1 Tax=Metasolibacillus sp. FSL K6-0083 TaxID=2921416 RepID=UPI00406D1E58